MIKNKNIVIYEIKSSLLTHILLSHDQPCASALFMNNRMATMGDNSGDCMIDSGSSGGGRGLEPPNFLQRGTEPLQKYICVMSSTSCEQYWYS